MNEASAIEAPPDAPVLPTSTRRPRPRTMPGWRGLLDTLLACIAPGSLQAQSGPVPPGGDPALACGQRPEGRSYWTEYGFCDMAVRGPAQAKGLVLWSHGVDGRKAQYQYPPPPIVRALALSGWDVVKINRNALAETEWYSTGVRHTDDALLRAQDAKARGYKAIILAGQSYGGGISIEANTKALGIDGVLALSPGYGSDATLSGENYRQHSAYLLASLSRQKGGRVVVLSAARDMYHPDRSTGSGFGGEMRKALAASRRPFVVFDETAPIAGHGAGETLQFATWFGQCLVKFLDPWQPAARGETACRAPEPVPRFLLPADLRQPAPGQGPSPWLGTWQGPLRDDKREVMIVVESVTAESATIVYSADAGPAKDLSMAVQRYPNARLSGNSIVIDRGRGWTITLVLSADGRSLQLSQKTADQRSIAATLARLN